MIAKDLLAFCPLIFQKNDSNLSSDIHEYRQILREKQQNPAEKRRQTPAQTLLEIAFEIMCDAKFDGESESEVGISKKCIQICPEGGQPLGG